MYSHPKISFLYSRYSAHAVRCRARRHRAAQLALSVLCSFFLLLLVCLVSLAVFAL